MPSKRKSDVAVSTALRAGTSIKGGKKPTKVPAAAMAKRKKGASSSSDESEAESEIEELTDSYPEDSDSNGEDNGDDNDEELSEEEEEEEEEDFNEGSADEDFDEEEEEDQQDEMETRDGSEKVKSDSSTGGVGSRKETKKQKTVERKQKKDENYTVLAESRKLWSRLSTDLQKDTKGSSERIALIDQLLVLWQNHMYDFILKHDGSRILQACLKYGNDAQRARIQAELLDESQGKDALIQLAKGPYGRFVLWKLLKYSPNKASRSALLAVFLPHVVSIARHRYAVRVLDILYSDYATPVEQRRIRESFYGPQFALFVAKHPGDSVTLEDVFSKEPTKKPYILQHLHKALSPVVQKGTLQFCVLLHRLLLEFLQYTPSTDDAAMTLLMKVRDQAVTILHTKEGALVALHCLAHLTAKDQTRMAISMKPFMQKIFVEEFGHMVVLRLLDSAVDKDFLMNNVLHKYLQNLKEYVSHKWARRFLLTLLLHARGVTYSDRPMYFGGQETVNVLMKDREKCRGEMNVTARSCELLASVLPTLLNAMRENAREWILDPLANDVMAEMVLLDVTSLALSGSEIETTILHLQKELVIALVKELTDDCPGDHTSGKTPSIPKKKHGLSEDSKVEEASKNSLMENFVANKWVQRIIKVANTSSSAASFAVHFEKAVHSSLLKWASSQGSFVIVRLMECPTTESTVRNALKSHAKLLTAAAEKGNQGAKLLIEKLSKEPVVI